MIKTTYMYHILLVKIFHPRSPVVKNIKIVGVERMSNRKTAANKNTT